MQPGVWPLVMPWSHAKQFFLIMVLVSAYIGFLLNIGECTYGVSIRAYSKILSMGHMGCLLLALQVLSGSSL